jgi:formate hydrogenlyase subunit 6/NADH:ubiquinone oxidoreductase subunit I
MGLLRIIASAVRTGQVTRTLESLERDEPLATKGRPALDPARCDGNGACEAACPTTAIRLGARGADGRRVFVLDYGACVFCGRCAAACAPAAMTITPNASLGTLSREDLVWRVSVGEAVSAQDIPGQVSGHRVAEDIGAGLEGNGSGRGAR